jgi:glycosyltransferase involved in cell wall biosynthesis
MNAGAGNPDLNAIEERLGRPLRVLHIGNIANNAYNNACIQRQYGIEADVLSYDYYHVMSTPEWEDAEFTGDIDANAPNWWGTSLKGWRRPDWFVQGPASSCLQYLRARRFGWRRLQKLLWLYLEARCLGYVRYMAKLKGQPIPPMPARLGVAIKLAEGLGIAHGPALKVSDAALGAIRALILPAPRMIEGASPVLPAGTTATAMDHAPASVARRFARKAELLGRAISRLCLETFILPGLRDPERQGRLASWWLGRQKANGGADRETILAEMDGEPTGTAQLRKLASDGMYRLRATSASINFRLTRFLSRCVGFLLVEEANKLKSYNSSIDTVDRDISFIKLFEINKRDFLNASIEDRENFIEYYSKFAAQFYRIFELYDIVQAYSVDGCLCLINGHQKFVSYEHGTLRDLPFGDDFYGIVTRLSYHASAAVFVTNSDVLPSVARMGLDPARVVYLPHAFDDRKLVDFRRENPDLQPPRSPPVIFSPTRQHWKDKSGSWTKGNDILFRAAARVAREGHDFRLHLVAWGQEIDDSKALIEELGLTAKVVWLPTMKKRELWAAYCRAHAVADQFTLPALGGVGFEAMALGRRLISAIDVDQLQLFFGQAPPCLSANTIEQCAAQLLKVVTDADDAAGLGFAAQEWMREYHSAERIVALQARAYKNLIA